MSDVHFLKVEETQYLRLRDHLLKHYPELAEDSETLMDTLEGESSIHDQLLAVLRSAREDKAYADALGGMIAEMKERRERIEARASKKRDVCLDVMERTGIRKLPAPDMTVSVGKGRQKVVITDPEAIPAWLMREKVIREPNKTAIAEVLEDGKDVPGATLDNGGSNLIMRVK